MAWDFQAFQTADQIERAPVLRVHVRAFTDSVDRGHVDEVVQGTARGPFPFGVSK